MHILVDISAGTPTIPSIKHSYMDCQGSILHWRQLSEAHLGHVCLCIIVHTTLCLDFATPTHTRTSIFVTAAEGTAR